LDLLVIASGLFDPGGILVDLRIVAGSNFPMAIDGEAHRLLVVFRSLRTLIVLSSQNRHVAAKIETAATPTMCDVFVSRKRVDVSCGEMPSMCSSRMSGATAGLRACRLCRERALRCSCLSSKPVEGGRG
jgi:hypothetical protein